MTPTKRFWQYLKPILEAQHGVKYVKLSDGNRMDRLTADSVSTDVYPCVFAIRPKYQGTDANSGTLWARFSTILYIFEKADLNDYDDQDAAYDLSEFIATQIAQQLFHDSKDYRCLFDLNQYQAEPVEYQMLDAAWGYEVKLTISLPANDLFC
ncbi:hypothetical protein [Siphonobacter curvatus]|uniref:Uncharacterized protein n=1 Tax=Siphonobacter curvatus TaxID=2094562 RepID=A0A2S7INC2_9BACT|nr:hypothetical protein [Siphonobacter curvatus]PQA59159.1 hypothetical protein C5O19_05750 [Siphonobacter curvatus]